VYFRVTDVAGYIGNNVMTGCQLVRVQRLSDGLRFGTKEDGQWAAVCH
jgi:hypothetical protein